MTDQNWLRLGELVRRRRQALGLSQADVADARGPSIATLYQIENATRESYQRRLLDRLEDALAWRPGSVKAILAGGDPVPVEPALTPAPPYSDPDLLAITELMAIDDEWRRTLVDLALVLRRRRREAHRLAG